MQNCVLYLDNVEGIELISNNLCAGNWCRCVCQYVTNVLVTVSSKFKSMLHSTGDLYYKRSGIPSDGFTYNGVIQSMCGLHLQPDNKGSNGSLGFKFEIIKYELFYGEATQF